MQEKEDTILRIRGPPSLEERIIEDKKTAFCCSMMSTAYSSMAMCAWQYDSSLYACLLLVSVATLIPALLPLAVRPKADASTLNTAEKDPYNCKHESYS